MTRHSAFLAVPMIAFSSLACANPPPYEDIDANGDGRIDAQEASRVAWIDFLSVDRNQDGIIDRDEYAMVENAPAPPFALVVE